MLRDQWAQKRKKGLVSYLYLDQYILPNTLKLEKEIAVSRKHKKVNKRKTIASSCDTEGKNQLLDVNYYNISII